jgi:DMSO/TMAO reductase YedYZ molybdopterin-dependent catalytic subunit
MNDLVPGGEAPKPEIERRGESPAADQTPAAAREASAPRDESAPPSQEASAPRDESAPPSRQASVPRDESAPSAPAAPSPAQVMGRAKDVPPRARRSSASDFLRERPELSVEIPNERLRARSRRDFLLFAIGALASAAGAWWLLPDRTRGRLAGSSRERLDSLAARLGLTRERAEGALDRALTFDDDVAEALYSRDRRVRTYDRSQVTPLRNNYDGQTPGPGYLPGWRLRVSGLASGREESFAISDLEASFPIHEQVTRLVCVEGWSAVAWWGGIRFSDLLDAHPPAPGCLWASLRSSVNLDGAGRPDPYYVSIDLDTARHPQTLLATQLGGRALPLEHGAPLRLLAPMKLGLKNIKAITEIAYTASEPRDYWNERGYSKYDGL